MKSRDRSASVLSCIGMISIPLLTSVSVLAQPVLAQEAAPATPTPATPTPTATLLDVQGILEPGDAALSANGSLYDAYRFEGQAGQSITIVLESLEFDPYVILMNAQGQTIGENDDVSPENLNSVLTITLPKNGTYQVLASAYSPEHQGHYTLTIRPTLTGQTQPPLSDRALRQAEANQLLVQGYVLQSTSQFQAALESFQQALPIYRAIGDRTGEGGALNNIGFVYSSLGDYPHALEYYQQALRIRQEMGHRESEGITLGNIGSIYHYSGAYANALDYYQQALTISRDSRDRASEERMLNNIGLVYDALGDYANALDSLQQALSIHQAIENPNPDSRLVEGTLLNNIGGIYAKLGDYPKALEYYQQALTISRDIDHQAGEARTLNNIGLIYYNLGDYAKALEYYQQALTISQTIRDRASEGLALNNIGSVYSHLGHDADALDYLQQALRVRREIGDRAGEASTLNNIGFLLADQHQPELAIVFLKQSVNQWEAIRTALQVLPTEQQESFAETVADTYRRLADLLLQQDRVLEAQQVLDLLKLQELQDYLRDVRGNAQTAQGLDFWQAEQQIMTLHNASLQRQDAFEQFIQQVEVEAQVAQLRRTARGQNLNPDQLASLQNELQQLDDPAVVLYPLILEDRLELVLVTPNGEPIRRRVNVSRAQLNAALATLLPNLENRTRDARPGAQQLYEWLIQPIAADLATVGATTILYAADGQLRYLPLGALYDGNQWLIQRFRINNITAASLMDFSPSQNPTPRVLAGAYSDRTLRYHFQIGTAAFAFSGLPHARTEVENIAAAVPNTTQLLNQAFSQVAVEAHMSDYSIIHLATHAEFVPGSPSESFILFGNGDRISLRDVSSWPIADADLVVLSACRTAVSGLGNGEEILGFGYQIQRTGARAAIASLWYVNDASTQTLMTAFYAALEQGLSETEALRQAQIALITGDFSTLGLSPDDIPSNPIHHPYYWAPFILIGNGL